MLEDFDFIQQLKNYSIDQEKRLDENIKVNGVTYGTIEDVEDPLEKSRVRVALDGRGGKYLTDWIPCSGSFSGKQTSYLIGMRAKVEFTGGDPTRGSVIDIIDDEENKNPPITGIGMRLPIYDSGNLPPASEENHGLVVIEKNGPMGSSWMCVCLARRGSFIWVRHCDLAHGHKSQDRGIQGADSGGDGEQPVKEFTVHDEVFPTSHSPYQKQSYSPPGDAAYYGAA